jgi:predicted MFS family arabinose efflux permease
MGRFSERTILLLLAAVQFTHIMDFMIMMPLGPQLMRELHIGPGHFSALVAAYTISSGLVGLLAAPFIDRFDRRKVLLLAYAVGAAVPLLAIGWGGQAVTTRVKVIARHSRRLQQGFGAVMIAFAVATYFDYDALIAAWLSRLYPGGQIGL